MCGVAGFRCSRTPINYFSDRLNRCCNQLHARQQAIPDRSSFPTAHWQSAFGAETAPCPTHSHLSNPSLIKHQIPSSTTSPLPGTTSPLPVEFSSWLCASCPPWPPPPGGHRLPGSSESSRAARPRAIAERAARLSAFPPAECVGKRNLNVRAVGMVGARSRLERRPALSAVVGEQETRRWGPGR
jgi:hypothetical protein